MTDERPDDVASPIERLASEFIDGELDDTARAEALADPDTRTVIETAIRDAETVREAIADVEPAPISTRERHLAAALDAWDRLPAAERTGERRDATPSDVDAAAAAGAAAVTAPPTSLRRRPRRSAAWLTAAAAALVLVLAGGLVLRAVTDRSDQDDSISSSLEGLDSTVVGEDRSATASGADDSDQFITADPDSETLPASDELAEENASDGVREVLSDEADEALASGSELPVQPEDLGPPPDTDLETLSTPDDVAAFAAAAIDAPVSPDVAQDDADDAAGGAGEAGSEDTAAAGDEGDDLSVAAAEPLCGAVDIVVGRAIYNGQLVIVGIDVSAEVAFAHLPETCRELLRVALP